MKKLKNKIFWTIFTILSLFIITILFIYNYQNYSIAQKSVNENLFRMNIERNNNLVNENFFKDDNPKRFIDAIIYTVMLDNNNNIVKIISHREDGNIPSNISNVVQDTIIKEEKNITHIGNLYWDKYSYRYEKNNYVVLIDNTKINERLVRTLEKSLILLLLSEIIIFLITKYIEKWIIKPVEESFNKQKQFIADASHELKTPLSVIMASAELLESEPKEKKWLNNIKCESVRMEKLIRSLLDLAKIENTEIIKEDIDLSKLIKITILSFESIIYEKKIKLKTVIEDGIAFNGCSEELRELVSILLDNAIKHSVGEIIVNLKKDKNNIIFEVINKGNPIPKDEEEKIFERFYRIDKSRNRNDDRYGLGLSIARNIVEKHSGKITANSNNGFTTLQVVFRKKEHF